MPKLQPPLTPNLESWQGTPRARDSLSASAPQLSGLASLGPSIATPALRTPGAWTSRCHGNRLPPARRCSLSLQPTFLAEASQSQSLQQRGLLVSHFGQWEATGRLYSENFLEPHGKGPFCPFLCNAAPAATRVRRSRLGPGSGVRGPGVQWPASSRAALGSRGPGHPSSFPRRVPATWAARLSSMWAGGRGRHPPAAAVATGAHSILTCRRTLNITEATM